jgi:hypothetical protein
VVQLKKELSKYGVESLRLASTTTTLPQYDKVVNLFQTLTQRLSTLGRLPEEKRKKIAQHLGGC